MSFIFNSMDDPQSQILAATNNGLSIFEHYIPDIKLHGPGKNFRAIFRDDGQNPDANVFYNQKAGLWCYHDFVNGKTLNPFDFVRKICNCDFKETLEIIRRDILFEVEERETKSEPKGSTITEFTLTPGEDFNYWFNYAPMEAMSATLQKYNVQALQSFSFKKSGKELSVKSGPEDPVFAFAISEECYKLYRPNATGKQAKHLWLGKKPEEYSDLFGTDHLDKFNEFILIVEGLKDTIVANANGIAAVGVDHATTRLRAKEIELLKSKCKHLLICYDIDAPGLKAAEKASKEHGLHHLNLTESLMVENGKDIADFFFKKHTANEIRELVAIVLAQEPPNKTEQVKEKPQRLSMFEKVEALINENFELRFNEVSNEIEFKCRYEKNSEFEVLNENNIYRFLQHNNIEFSMAKLTSLLRSDFVPRFNPFLNYFKKLSVWVSGSDVDYITKLCSYIPVKDTQRFPVQFCKALVRTVACSLNDKIINKQALILVHEEQNSGKTTFIRWLCPPSLDKYIAENISTDKDSLIALSDNIIINMDELATLSRAEINTLKSMFSKETIKIRRPYDKNATSAPRRASFFGSTNKAEFLTDETGSVRWLCFELTGKINWDYKKDLNIDDIWRQAYSLYQNGFKYELTPDEIHENEIANRQYQVTTPELELIQKNYAPGSKEQHDAFYQATDFLNNLTEKCPTARLNLNNIGKALKIFGFERTSKRTDKYPIKGYFIKFSEIQN